MTHIVNFPTKKAFKEAVIAGKQVWADDPSMFSPHSYTFNDPEGNPPVGKMVFVTNHPKRSWFANITLKPDGKWSIK